ncbi:MAG: alanine dehydrogenase, partial [Muribaculaceae bacterium]|nr:alanine dehydrogenase [Muribaculaceae bacterium]
YINCIALDLIENSDSRKPFADILNEIDGRAALAIASSLLADSVHGKGILMGGVAGIVPCEVTVLGSGFDALAAARTAIGLGATVRMFDNDSYSLREADRMLGPAVITSAMHPRVLVSALRSADVVVAGANRGRTHKY